MEYSYLIIWGVKLESTCVKIPKTGYLKWILKATFSTKTTEKYTIVIWTASSEFGTYRLCEQRRFRRTCASAQSRQNLRCSLIQAVSQEEPSDRKPDPWPLWMAGHAQLQFVMTECSKTQIRLTGLIWSEEKTKYSFVVRNFSDVLEDFPYFEVANIKIR